MGLESASYPNQLVATNPTGSDQKSTADDHIRLLKSVIQTTFPNITGAMTAAQADLNKVGVTQPQTSNDTSVSSTAFVQTAVAAAITAIGAGASMWVSGTTYALGNVVWSPSNYQTYRRIIAGAGTTDPASDATNWVLVSGNVQTTATQTLTNKTLTSPVISTISNTGTLTLPTATDTLVGRATTDTLTNKTLAAPVITGGASISGNVSVTGTGSFTSAVNVVTVNTTSGSGAVGLIQGQRSGVTKGYVGIDTSDNFGLFDNTGTMRAGVSSTGLAVTGALSAEANAAEVLTFGSTSRKMYGRADTGGVSLLDGPGQTGNGWYFDTANNKVKGFISSASKFEFSSTGLAVTGDVLPEANGTRALGSTSLRWSQVWCTAGAFNTSDATLKTPIRTMQAKELAAGYQMAQELGTFQWLESVKEKGDKARRHVGLTVQRAAEIMESHGLKPWSYGFMGYDKWDAVTEIVDATEDDDDAYQEEVTRQKTEKQTSQKQTVEVVNGKPVLKAETIETDVPVTEQIQVVDADGNPVFTAVPEVPEIPAVLDEEGNEVTPAVAAVPAHQVPMLHAVPVMETVTVWRRVKEVMPAGESYAFRSDQLAFFIAAGVAAKVGA